eukprot:COSAG01_NODE_2842_length_6990_cov_10.019301_11_plen_125_part_00
MAILFPMIGSEAEEPEQEQWFSGTWHVEESDKGGAAAVIFDDGDRLDIDSGGEWTFNGTWPFWNDTIGLRHSISTAQQLVQSRLANYRRLETKRGAHWSTGDDRGSLAGCEADSQVGPKWHRDC